MTFKEFVLSRMRLFFFLTTMILAASSIFGGMIAPDQEIKYYHLFSPIIIAACCVLPTCVTFYKKEPTVGQYIIRQIIEIILIEAVVLFLVSVPEGVDKILFYVVLGAVILVIYLLAMVMMWLEKYLESKKLTEQLINFQHSENASEVHRSEK